MNSKLSKKLGTGVMVLLITVCFIPAMAGAFAPEDGRQDKVFAGKDHHRPPLRIWRDPQIIQELELTKEQVKQLRDADFTFREKHLALKAHLDGLRLQMDKALAGPLMDGAVAIPGIRTEEISHSSGAGLKR